HALPALRAHPLLRGREQGREDLGIVLGLDEAELAVVAALVLIPTAVDLGGDAPHRLSVAPGQEVLGLRVLEVGVLLLVQEVAALIDQRRHPRRALVQAEGKLDEPVELTAALHGTYLD